MRIQCDLLSGMVLKAFSVDAKLGNDGVMYLEEQKKHM